MPRETLDDPQAVARAAGLRYVTDAMPGITRRGRGQGFEYHSADGRRIREEETLRRVRSLAIPPAYHNVWICPVPSGHLQATGRDAAGRKQYRYHPQWNVHASQAKYGNLVAFARCLPKLRRRITRDLKRTELDRRTVVATIVRLLDETLIRVGNDEYVHQNGSFGLTTLRNRHVKRTGRALRFSFNGKSGQQHEIRLENGRLAKLVQRCQDLPGQRLFQYVDGDGEPEAIRSEDVNEYLREVTGADVTAKDFRTWGGTVLASIELARLGPVEGKARRKKAVVAAVRDVAARLGNRPAACRKYYIHPAVFDAFEAGELHEIMGCPAADEAAHTVPATGLSAAESAVLALLERSTLGRTRTSASKDTARPNRGRSRRASSLRSRGGRPL